MTTSEAFDLSKVHRELCVLTRNEFNEVAEATTKMKSDQEISRAECDELKEKLEPLKAFRIVTWKLNGGKGRW